MPRKRTPPTYLKRTEKGKDYAYCYLFGAQKRLGSYGTKESFRRFESCLAAYEQESTDLAEYSTKPDRKLTVGEIALRYFEHMEDRHSRNTLCKDRVLAARTGMRHLRSVPPDDGDPGQQCCYDAAGNLITAGNGAGTPDIVAPYGPWDAWHHYEEDVAPWNWCVAAGLLDCYLNQRPPNNGNNCLCNPPGHAHCTNPPQCP